MRCLAVLARMLLPRRLRREVVDDLREEFELHVLAERGPIRARLWFVGHVVLAAVDLRFRHRAGALLPPGPMPMSWTRDLRFACRALRRAPSFTLAAVATLAIGIGATSAAFGLFKGVLLDPLPYPQAGRLVELMSGMRASRAMVPALREGMQSVGSISAYAGYDLTLLGAGEPIVLDGERVTEDYFAVLGARPVHGRLPTAEDGAPGAEPVVVLSHRIWTERFSQDPAIVGRLIELDGGGVASRRVIGVLPAAFRPLLGSHRAFWVPLVMDPASDAFHGRFLRLVGRLAGDIEASSATSELRAVVTQMRQQWPEAVGEDEVASAAARPLLETTVGSAARPLLYAMLASAGVLLLACTNLTNMLLVRWVSRLPELGIRRALGAGRAHLMRQLLLENIVLAVAASALGAGLGVSVMTVVRTRLAPYLPRAEELGLDGTVLAASIALGLGAALLAALPPAVRLERDPRSARRDLARSESDAGGERWNAGLVVAQVALAMTLLVGAGLAGRSLLNLTTVETGFEPEGVALLQLSPLDSAYAGAEERVVLYERLLDVIRAINGVSAVGAIHVRPFTPENWSLPLVADGTTLQADERSPATAMRIVTPGYFAAAGIDLIAGRDFNGMDRTESEPVTIVNHALARSLWSDRDAVGESIRLYHASGPLVRVVGVVADARHFAPSLAATTAVHFPHAQRPQLGMHLVVRSIPAGPPATAAVRAAVRAVDSSLTVGESMRLDEAITGSITDQRLLGGLLASVAGLAIVLAASGVHAVLSRTALRHSHRIAVSIALGATPARAVGVLAWRTVRILAVGIVLGGLMAIVAWRGLAGLLFETAPNDAATLAAAALGVACVGLLAALRPARRAARRDPVVALHRGP